MNKLNMIYKLLPITIAGLLLFCSSSNNEEYILSRFDLSSDDRKVIFSQFKNDNTSIYEFDIETNTTEVIVAGDKDWSYMSPTYFGSDSEILYLKFSNQDENENYICRLKNNGEETCFFKPESFIAEVIAISKEEIVFPMADTISVSSPIGMKSAKGFDLYKYNIKTNGIERLTSKKYYSIFHINKIEDQIALGINSSKYNGLYLTHGLDSLRSISPKNDPRNDIGLYSKPVFSEYDNSLVFTAPYQIYKMNLDDLDASLVLDHRGESLITGLNTFHESPKVLFTKQGDASFYSVNLDGTNLKRIEVNLQD